MSQWILEKDGNLLHLHNQDGVVVVTGPVSPGISKLIGCLQKNDQIKYIINR